MGEASGPLMRGNGVRGLEPFGIASPGFEAGVNSAKQARAESPMPLWIAKAAEAASGDGGMYRCCARTLPGSAWPE